MSGRRSSYTREDLIAVLQECAKDLGRSPRFLDFQEWARRPHVLGRGAAVPRSWWPFLRVFGSFAAARDAAGVGGTDLRNSGYRLSRERILTDLRLVAAGDTSDLTVTVYMWERQRIQEESIRAGKPRRLAGVATILRQFGSWSAAIAALEEES